MTDVSNKLFLCYAWEDLGQIKQIVLEIEHEIEAKISDAMINGNVSVLDDTVSECIIDSEIFIVFISDASKRSDYVRQCVAHATHLNKNILPLEIDKQGILSSKGPREFKFRSKTYSATDPESKGAFLAQLKASLALEIEGGDSFGALLHIVSDRNTRISRYGKVLGMAQPNTDCKIRLAKGKHQLRLNIVLNVFKKKKKEVEN